jgi:hypothetical protein
MADVLCVRAGGDGRNGHGGRRERSVLGPKVESLTGPDGMKDEHGRTVLEGTRSGLRAAAGRD